VQAVSGEEGVSQSRWRLWCNRRMQVQGVCIVFQCADYGLKLMDNGLDEKDRREWLLRLMDVLNEARTAGKI
jgi:hypothetical protein